VSLDPDLLAILVCPVTRTRLVYDEAAQELISEAAGVAYPIRNGTPIMLIEEARILEPQTATP
jgi:uncharacterized protein YbaR (Trm112 family)